MVNESENRQTEIKENACKTPERINPAGGSENEPKDVEGQQITLGMIAKSLLAWSSSAGIEVTQRRVKQFVNSLFPTISSKELLSRSRKIFYVMDQLEQNGWLESEEAGYFKKFDSRMKSIAAQEKSIAIK